jgi:hypothetical protein
VSATWRRVSSAEIFAISTWSAAWFLRAQRSAARNGYAAVALKEYCVRGWVMLPPNPRAASRIVVLTSP